MCSPMKLHVVNPKREWQEGQRHNNGDKILYWKNTALDVMLCEACVCNRDTLQCVRIRLWPLRRDDSSRVLIGAAGMRRSYWCRRNVGALIGQRACRLLALARAAIDSTRVGASGSLQAATTGTYINIFLIINFSQF